MANIITTLTANGTWVCPTPAPTGVMVTLIGGGGGGATSNTTAGGSGGGGGASCDSANTWNPSAGVTYTAVIPAPSGAGALGGTVSWKQGATVIAQVVGGKGGTIAAAGAGGLSTNANAVTPSGWNAFNGGSGAARSTTTGGGGGGAAGQAGAGGNASGTTGGTGSGLGGNGGTGGAPGVAGGAGTIAGGGGGGSGAGTGLTGGSADNGKVRILYPDTTPPTIGASTTWNISTTIDPAFLSLIVSDDGDTNAQLVGAITSDSSGGLFQMMIATATEVTNYGLTLNQWYLICPRGITPGTYTVGISLTDTSSNQATATFTVNVSETAGLSCFSNTIIGSGSFSWTAPSGTTKVAIEAIGCGGVGNNVTSPTRAQSGGDGGNWADCVSFTVSAGDTVQGTLPAQSANNSANNTVTVTSTVSGSTTNKIILTTAGTGETKRAKYTGGGGGNFPSAGSTNHGSGGGAAATWLSVGANGVTGTSTNFAGGVNTLTGWWGGNGGDGGPPDSTGLGDGSVGFDAGGGGGGAGGGSTGNLGGAGGNPGVKIWYLAPSPPGGGSVTFF